jgi:hypothetical protein
VNGDTAFFLCYFPFNPLQVKNENRVKHGNQEQRDERRHGEPTDLRVMKSPSVLICVSGEDTLKQAHG